MSLSGCQKQPTKSAAELPKVIVQMVQAEQLPISRDWVATLDGSSNANVKANVQGYLQQQFYNNGSLVRKGDRLFQIDPRPFEAAFDQAQAALGKAQAKQVSTELAEKRSIKLYETKTISTEERDNALTDNASAKAQVLAAIANLHQAQINLDYTTVTAPITGVAGIAGPGIGDLVGPASGNLTSISCIDPIKAIFQISEPEYLRAAELIKSIVSGTSTAADIPELRLVLGSGDVHPSTGTVSSVNRQFDVRTGTIQVEALFPNPAGTLRPGIFARVRLTRIPRQPQVVIPQRAVIDVQGINMVAVVRADGVVDLRRIEMGERVGSKWIVLSGLTPGERIVVEGVQKARSGQKVRVDELDRTTSESAQYHSPDKQDAGIAGHMAGGLPAN